MKPVTHAWDTVLVSAKGAAYIHSATFLHIFDSKKNPLRRDRNACEWIFAPKDYPPMAHQSNTASSRC